VNFDFEQFRARGTPHLSRIIESSALPRHKKDEKFLAGPIPWNWWTVASGLPGKALHVASGIWHLAFIKKSGTIRLGRSVLDQLQVNRRTGYRALRALEEAGLIRCDRGPGRLPIITLLSIPEDQSARVHT
jgi:hypothetical protein